MKSRSFPCVMRVRRRGFILLFGTKLVVSDDPDGRPHTAVCPHCGRQTTMLAKRART